MTATAGSVHDSDGFWPTWQAGALYITDLGYQLDVRLVDSKGRTVIARVVCVPTEGEDRYYLTTLLRSVFTPCDIAELYRIRWEVELFFRNWKGGVRMDHVHRLRNPTSLAVSVTAAMLAALLSRDLHAALEALSETPTPKMSESKATVPSSMDGFSPS